MRHTVFGEKRAITHGFLKRIQILALHVFDHCNLCNGLVRLRRELELPADLSQAGVDPARLRRSEPELIRSVLADPCCATNPTKVTDYMVRQVLEEVAGHG